MAYKLWEVIQISCPIFLNLQSNASQVSASNAFAFLFFFFCFAISAFFPFHWLNSEFIWFTFLLEDLILKQPDELMHTNDVFSFFQTESSYEVRANRTLYLDILYFALHLYIGCPWNRLHYVRPIRPLCCCYDNIQMMMNRTPWGEIVPIRFEPDKTGFSLLHCRCLCVQLVAAAVQERLYALIGITGEWKQKGLVMLKIHTTREREREKETTDSQSYQKVIQFLTKMFSSYNIHEEYFKRESSTIMFLHASITTFCCCCGRTVSVCREWKKQAKNIADRKWGEKNKYEHS